MGGIGAIGGGMFDPAQLAQLQQFVDIMGISGNGSATGSKGTTVPAITDGEDDLVKQVKSVQRDPQGKDLWTDYVQRIGGKRDPSLRTSEELQTFLAEIEVLGLTPNPEKRPRIDSQNKLVDRVKALQKTAEGNEAWKTYVGGLGSEKYDPALRTDDELQAFLDKA